MTLLNGKEVIVSDAALQRLVPLSSFFVVVVQAHGRVIFQHLLLLSEAAGSSLSKKKKKNEIPVYITCLAPNYRLQVSLSRVGWNWAKMRLKACATVLTYSWTYHWNDSDRL